MRAIFLADAHLKGPEDAAQKRLLALFATLRGPAGHDGGGDGDRLCVDQLIIAGDFFDFWFARGERVYPGFREIIDRLTAIQGEGVRIRFCEGNHDFFLGDYFTRRSGIEVFPEWAHLEMDGRKILVSHGDTIDRANRKYLALRSFLRGDFARFLQRILPLGLLWRMASFSSKASKGMSGQSRERLAEVMYAYARERFGEGYDAVIVGHCHLPLIRTERGPRPRTFATLGDWDTCSTYLLYEDGLFSLNRFSQKG